MSSSSSTTTTPDTSTTETTGTPIIDTDHHNDRLEGGDQPATDTAATDRAATAGDRLWAALHARPGGTAEELSADAGIGRSTAAKILARWVADGTAARVPTDRKRSASRYAIPTPDDSAPDDTTDGTVSANVDPHSAQRTRPQDADPSAGAVNEDPTDNSGGPGTAAGSGRAEDHEGTTAGDAPDDGRAAEAGPPDVPSDVEVDAAAPDTTGSVPEPATTSAPDVVPGPDGAVDTPPDGPIDTHDRCDGADPTQQVCTSRATRLAPGALHGMVEDYLRDHPDEEFGPTKIGHDLGRSTGAVGNALERLVASGYAVRTKDRPKRYAVAPAEPTGDGDGDGDGVEGP